MATELLKVKNRAYSKLAAAITAGATSLTVTAGDGANFPSTYPFHLTIEDEIVSCTNRSTDTLTIARAQQSTTAATHANKSYVALNITAKSMTDLNTAVNFIEKYADYGLAFYGKVTTYTDTTHFKVAGLLGLGASTFLPAAGTPYEIYVFKADGAAPQGEQTPVVAYTTADGTFQHAAFSVILAVDDEVLILHPLLASLGTKATAAATGAVTTDDYAMAYLKQLVTELQAVDALVDAITPAGPTNTQLNTAIALITGDLDNATDGLGALKALIDAVQADVGNPTGETLASISAKIGNIARSLDVVIGARWDSSGDLGTDIAQLLTYTDILDDATNGLAAIKAEVEGLGGVAMRGTDSAALASSWTGALATALGNYTAALATALSAYTAAKAAFLDEAVSTPKGILSTDWKGNFNWDTSAYTTVEQDISALFSTALALATRRKYTVKLDLTNVEADGDFVSLYLAVKEKIDGTNYRAIDRKTVLLADIAATAEPGIIIEIPATSENIQITMQMTTALAGDATIYYAVVKEHLE